MSQTRGFFDQAEPWQESGAVGDLDTETGAGVEFQQQRAAVAVKHQVGTEIAKTAE